MRYGKEKIIVRLQMRRMQLFLTCLMKSIFFENLESRQLLAADGDYTANINVNDIPNEQQSFLEWVGSFLGSNEASAENTNTISEVQFFNRELFEEVVKTYVDNTQGNTEDTTSNGMAHHSGHVHDHGHEPLDKSIEPWNILLNLLLSGVAGGSTYSAIKSFKGGHPAMGGIFSLTFLIFCCNIIHINCDRHLFSQEILEGNFEHLDRKSVV